MDADFTFVMIEAVEKMIMAGRLMSEVDYVYDTYRRYRKLNPMIANSNTKLADRENIERFDGYAREAVELYQGIPPEAIEGSMLMGGLTALLQAQYRYESEALKRRLQIYDSILEEDAVKLRSKKARKLAEWARESEAEKMSGLLQLMEQNAEIEMKKQRCCRKIEMNEVICRRYSRRIFWRRNARVTVEEARRHIGEQQNEWKVLEEQQAGNQREKLRELESLANSI